MTGGWAKVPEAVLLHEDLSDGAVRLYMLLARYGESSIPKRATLAERLRISVTTVDRRIAELVAAGFLDVSHNYAPDGRQVSSTYRLVISEDPPLPGPTGVVTDDDPASSDSRPPTPQKRGGGGRTDDAPRKRITKKERDTPNGVSPSSPDGERRKRFTPAAKELLDEVYAARRARDLEDPYLQGGFPALAQIVQGFLDRRFDRDGLRETLIEYEGAWTINAIQHQFQRRRRGGQGGAARLERNAAARERVASLVGMDDDVAAVFGGLPPGRPELKVVGS